MNKRLHIIGLIGITGIFLPALTAAQTSDPFQDSQLNYDHLIEEHRQQEEMQWRPLLELVQEEPEIKAKRPLATSVELHANAESHLDAASALFFPDETGNGGLLLIPANHSFVNRLKARECRSAPKPDTPGFDSHSAAAVGEATSFALRGAPSDCEAQGLTFEAIGADNEQDVGLSLSTALTECVDGQCKLRGVKGEIRVGEFEQTEDGRGGWYMYAAADGTRVVWDERPSGFTDLKDAVDVSDSLTMGDIEAGIMLSRGTADVSINYVRRTAKFQTWDTKVVDNADYIGVKVSFD